MNFSKSKAIILILILGLIIPTMASTPEPTCYPPEEWYDEYCEWVAEQQELQRNFTNETGYGLGMLLTFSQWAEMREANDPYWWKTGTWTADGVYYARLFVEAYA